MIKGLGGALVREKVVAVAARKHYFLIGDEKLVKRLGAAWESAGGGGAVCVGVCDARDQGARDRSRRSARTKDGAEYISDNGNLVLDCGISPIRNPARLERELQTIPGVVGTGLFVGIADVVLVASQDGKVKTMRRRS